jgi:hypothetical protein
MQFGPPAIGDVPSFEVDSYVAMKCPTGALRVPLSVGEDARTRSVEWMTHSRCCHRSG